MFLENLKLSIIKTKAVEDLEILAKKIRQFDEGREWISRSFTLKDDLEGLVDSIANENSKRCFIYVVTSDNIEAIYQKYRLFNLESPKVSKINSFDRYETKCLYVGSGRNCRDRLRQHLGITFGSNGTYSLHLKKILGNTSDNVNFCIFILPLGNDVDSSVMQSLEDSLWRMLLPCFGKLGGR